MTFAKQFMQALIKEADEKDNMKLPPKKPVSNIKVNAEEYEAGDEADTLEAPKDFYKGMKEDKNYMVALKLEEQRLKKRLTKIAEEKQSILKRVVKNF